MREYLGLIIYVAIMILGSILRKAAEQRAKQIQMPLATDEEQIHTITLDDMLAGESLPSDTRYLDISDQDYEQSWDEDLEDLDDLDDSDWERAYQPQENEPTEGSTELPVHPSWDQAIVFSEIIREPRAKRPWPSR